MFVQYHWMNEWMAFNFATPLEDSGQCPRQNLWLWVKNRNASLFEIDCYCLGWMSSQGKMMISAF